MARKRDELGVSQSAMLKFFLKYDVEGNGTLTKAQLASMLSDLGYESTPDYLESLTESFGSITPASPGG